MPITGRFEADFTQFERATESASGKLLSFEQNSKRAAAGIGGMDREMQRVNPRISDMHASFNRFDGILASVGLNISSEIRALRELGDVGSSTAKEIGAVATAGLALGTAVASFKLTSAILEFTGLNKAIGDAAVALYDFGLAAATAAAKQDTLDKASDIAKRKITDMGEAVRIVTEDNKRFQAAAVAANDALVRSRAPEESAKAIAGWHAEIAKITSAGLLPSLIRDIDSQNFSLKTLSDRYRVSVDALEEFSRKHTAAMKTAAEQAKLLQAQEEALAATMKAHWADVGTILDRVFGQPQLKAAQDWMDAVDALGGSVEQLSSKDLADLEAAMLAGIDALARSGHLTDDLSSRMAALAVQAAAAAEAMRGVAAVIDTSAEAEWQNALATDAAREAYAKANAALGDVPGAAGAAEGAVRGLGSAAQSASGFFAGMTAELYNAIRAAQQMDEAMGKDPLHWSRIGGYTGTPNPTGGRIAGSLSSGGQTVIVNVTQPLGTPAQVSKAVSDALVGSMTGKGQRF